LRVDVPLDAGASIDSIFYLAPISPAVNDIFKRPQNKYFKGQNRLRLLVIAGT
jgi:hypothetical protein